jgi:DUF971 family protein
MTVNSAPESIVQRRNSLLLRWPEEDAVLDVTELRAACPCADCRAAALQGRPWFADATVQLAEAIPVGHYALQLRFSDGHDRGIYPWALLHGLSTAPGRRDMSA